MLFRALQQPEGEMAGEDLGALLGELAVRGTFYAVSAPFKLGWKAYKYAQERRAEQAALQRRCQELVLAACSDSLAAFESIPKDLLSAEEHLDAAESEFQDSAFSPFWDSIERAMRKLGALDGNVKLIAERFGQYTALAPSYDGTPPPFPVHPEAARRIGAANDTAARLQKLVRQAQRNFQFATIYEQRKTSDILITGFTNLGDAIYGLGARLQDSIGTLGAQINDLSSTVTTMGDNIVGAVDGVSSAVRDVSSKVGEVSSKVGTVSSAVREASSRVGDVSSAIKDADEKFQAAMTDQASRQERALRMLDNIQHRRVPR
jgi:hypothetical protein